MKQCVRDWIVSCVSRLRGAVSKKDCIYQFLTIFLFVLRPWNRRGGKTPFRFESRWLQSEGFVDIVKEWWGEAKVTGYASYVVASKLKVVKEKLKKWNRDVFGNSKLKSMICWV